MELDQNRIYKDYAEIRWAPFKGVYKDLLSEDIDGVAAKSSYHTMGKVNHRVSLLHLLS